MAESTLDRVRRTLSDLFSLPLASISAATVQADVEAWDSMGHLMFIEALEQEFGVEISPENIESMRDVAAVVRVLDAR